MKFNTKKAIITMFTLSVLTILTLNFGIKDSQQQEMVEIMYAMENEEKVMLERKSIIKDSLPETMKSKREPASKPLPETSEQQVIVVQMPTQQQGVDWKSLISWVIAALNGVVLLVVNIKNLRKL